MVSTFGLVTFLRNLKLKPASLYLTKRVLLTSEREETKNNRLGAAIWVRGFGFQEQNPGLCRSYKVIVALGNFLPLTRGSDGRVAGRRRGEARSSLGK